MVWHLWCWVCKTNLDLMYYFEEIFSSNLSFVRNIKKLTILLPGYCFKLHNMVVDKTKCGITCFSQCDQILLVRYHIMKFETIPPFVLDSKSQIISKLHHCLTS